MLFAVSSWTGTIFTTGMIANILTIVAVILTIIAIPAVWTAIKIQSNKWKVQGKQRSVFFINTIIILFLATLTIFLFYGSGPNDAIKTLAYMLIGAFVLPIFIWSILSFYHKILGR